MIFHCLFYRCTFHQEKMMYKWTSGLNSKTLKFPLPLPYGDALATTTNQMPRSRPEGILKDLEVFGSDRIGAYVLRNGVAVSVKNGRLFFLDIAYEYSHL